MLHTKRRVDWAARVVEYSTSELPMREWCEQNGCTENQLKYWIKKARKLEQKLGRTWAPVEVSDSSSHLFEDQYAQLTPAAVITIVVGSARIEVRAGFDPHLLTDVLAVVAATC